MIKQENVYKIGKLGKPHGVKGELSFMFDDDIFDRVDADCLLLNIDDILVPFFIEEYRFRGSETALVKFDGIDTQDDARELTNIDVFFPRDLSDNDDATASFASIIGYKLIDNHTNNSIGDIISVDTSTLNTLMEVNVGNSKTILVPASNELIVEVNVEKRELIINIPDGILDLE